MIELVKAIEDHDLRKALALIKTGVDVNAQDRQNSALFAGAMDERNLELLKVLVQHGAIIDARNKGGQTALGAACEFGNLKAVDYLLGLGANAQARDDLGDTPLHMAMDCAGRPSESENLTAVHRTKIAMALLQHGARLNATDDVGFTPLDYAESGNCGGQLIRFLKDSGATRGPRRKSSSAGGDAAK